MYGLSKGVHTQQLISPLTPAPWGRKCRLTHSPSLRGGLTSWKAVRQLSLPRKPGAGGGGGVVCVTVFLGVLLSYLHPS